MLSLKLLIPGTHSDPPVAAPLTRVKAQTVCGLEGAWSPGSSSPSTVSAQARGLLTGPQVLGPLRPLFPAPAAPFPQTPAGLAPSVLSGRDQKVLFSPNVTFLVSCSWTRLYFCSWSWPFSSILCTCLVYHLPPAPWHGNALSVQFTSQL